MRKKGGGGQKFNFSRGREGGSWGREGAEGGSEGGGSQGGGDPVIKLKRSSGRNVAPLRSGFY